jgi:hypothetical protein
MDGMQAEGFDDL